MSKTSLRSLQTCYAPVKLCDRYYYYHEGAVLSHTRRGWRPSSVPLSLVEYSGQDESEFGKHYAAVADGLWSKDLTYSWVYRGSRWRYPDYRKITDDLTEYIIIVHSKRLQDSYRARRISNICYSEYPSVIHWLKKQTTKMIDAIDHFVTEDDRRKGTSRKILYNLECYKEKVRQIWSNNDGTLQSPQLHHDG